MIYCGINHGCIETKANDNCCAYCDKRESCDMNCGWEPSPEDEYYDWKCMYTMDDEDPRCDGLHFVVM